MEEYENVKEGEILAVGIHEDELTIELSDNHEYKYFLFVESKVGKDVYEKMCAAAKAHEGLFDLFEANKSKASDKW